MGNGAPFYVVTEERKRTLSVPISLVHVNWTPVQMRLCAYCQRDNTLQVSGELD